MTNIKQAMIFAAGSGDRFDNDINKNGPISLTEINETSLIEKLILSLKDAGIERILVSSHYLADILKAHLETISDKYSLEGKIQLEISYEPELLGTGGTIKKNQEFFENKPFFGLNSNVIYFDLADNLENLEKKLEEYPEAEIILTATEIENIRGFHMEKRDFSIKNDKVYTRPEDDLLYTGLQLINNVKLDYINENSFSIDKPYRELGMKGELYGIKFQGELFHIGDINAYMEAQQYYQSNV